LAVELEYTDKSPINKVRFPRLEEKPRDRYLTQDERLRLLNAIREHRAYILPIIQYMFLVPCRISELTQAKREQYSPLLQQSIFPTARPIFRFISRCLLI
jgi:integrase